MPTNRNTWKTSSSTRRTGGSYSVWSGWSNNRRPTSQSNRSTTSNRSSWGSTGVGSGSSASWNTTTYSPNKFSTQRNEITAKIGSFRTINQQVTGAGKVKAFSPATCSKWIGLVNDGCNVYKFTHNEFCRHFGSQFNYCTPTAAQRILSNRFGQGIKGVTRGKGNTWLVAATDRVTARPFSTYNWK
jgi:hypothetical protein